jgi:hypothetical protein
MLQFCLTQASNKLWHSHGRDELLGNKVKGKLVAQTAGQADRMTGEKVGSLDVGVEHHTAWQPIIILVLEAPLLLPPLLSPILLILQSPPGTMKDVSSSRGRTSLNISISALRKNTAAGNCR